MNFELQKVLVKIKSSIQSITVYEHGLHGTFYQHLATNNLVGLNLGGIVDENLNVFQKTFQLSWLLIKQNPRVLNQKIALHLAQSFQSDCVVCLMLTAQKCLMTIILFDYQRQYEIILPQETIFSKKQLITWYLTKITQIFCEFFIALI